MIRAALLAAVLLTGCPDEKPAVPQLTPRQLVDRALSIATESPAQAERLLHVAREQAKDDPQLIQVIDQRLAALASGQPLETPNLTPRR